MLKALDRLCAFVMVLIIMLTAVMVGAMCAQVFWRYALNDSLIWPEEVSRYAFIWVSCLGMSIGVRRQDLIAIDVLWLGRSQRVRLAISILAGLLTIPVLILFAWEGGVLIQVVEGQRAAATNLPVAWVYVALPFSSSVALLFVGEVLVKQVRAFLSEKAGAE